MVDGRIAQRRAEVLAERRRARLRRTMIVVAAALLLASAVWFERSEYATVASVTVVGTVRLDPQGVIGASGVEVGDRALRLRRERIGREVRALTLVRSVRVTRPDLRSILITVEERAPVYVAVHRGTAVLVDRDGVVIDTGMDARLPVVRLRSAPPQPGELVAGHAALANAHRVWTGLSGPLRSRVLEVLAPDEDGLELVLSDAPLIRFGRAERIEEKVRVLGAILEDVIGTEVTMVDVRVPDRPTFGVDAGAGPP
jgi:cell division protein FtsQ